MVFDGRSRQTLGQGRVHRTRMVPTRAHPRPEETMRPRRGKRMDHQPRGIDAHPQRRIAARTKSISPHQVNGQAPLEAPAEASVAPRTATSLRWSEPNTRSVKCEKLPDGTLRLC